MKATSLLFAAAGVLAALSVLAPLWEFRMSAPQYPGEALHVRVLRSGLAGDLQEVDTLQKYIGVKFPTDLPELDFVTPALLALAALLLLAAVAGEGRPGRIVRVGATVAVFAVLAAALAALQVRLHAVGHERDPKAPITAVKDFTPPAIGPVIVGNFTVWSYPHVGGLALALAAALSVVGTRKSFPRRSALSAASRVSEALP